jgi:hypothetical protein
MILSALAVLSALSLANAMDPPVVLGFKGYGFGQAESHPHAGVETADGGFLMVGDGVDYNDLRVQRHIFVMKTDNVGNLLWQQSFGDTGYNYGKFGCQLADGKYLIAGAKSVRKGDAAVPQ